LSESEIRPAAIAPVFPRLRLGGGPGADPSAVARAEAALKSLSANFETWMADELAKIEAARARISAEGLTAETGEGLYMRAHDLKGLGATYEYPIVTRLAGSLCELIHDPASRAKAPMALVDSHLAAIKRAVADKIRTDDHPWARATSEDLEARVAEVRGG